MIDAAISPGIVVIPRNDTVGFWNDDPFGTPVGTPYTGPSSYFSHPMLVISFVSERNYVLVLVHGLLGYVNAHSIEVLKTSPAGGTMS